MDKPKNKIKINKPEANIKSQDENKLEIKEFIFDFESLDMNNHENLKQFLKYFGIPFRPLKEIQQELNQFILKKYVLKIRSHYQKVIKGLLDII